MPKINPAEFLSTLSPEALEYVKAGGGDAGKEAIANMTKDSSKNLGKDLANAGAKKTEAELLYEKYKANKAIDDQSIAQDFLKDNPSLAKDVPGAGIRTENPNFKSSPEALDSSVEKLNREKNPEYAQKMDEIKEVNDNTNEALKSNDPNVGGPDDTFVQKMNQRLVPGKANQSMVAEAPMTPVEAPMTPVEAPKAPVPGLDRPLNITPPTSQGPTLMQKLLAGTALGGAAAGAGMMSPVEENQQKAQAPQLSDEDKLKAIHGDSVPDLSNENQLDSEPDNSDDSAGSGEMVGRNFSKQPGTELPKSQELADSLAKTTPSRDLFADAQNKQTMAILGNQLGAAGDIIGGAIARTGPNAQAQQLFKEQAGQAGNITKQFQERIAMQEHDPNSDVSKAARERLKKAGVKISDNISAAQIKSFLAPAIEKEELAKHRNEFLKNKQAQLDEFKKISRQDRLDKHDTDRIDKANKLITAEISSSRSSFGRAANTHQAAEKMEALTQGIDPNDLDKRQITEIARSLDSMLSSGQPTISGMNKLIPASARGDVSKIAEYISGIPKGAGQGEFVSRLMSTVQREKQLAHKQMGETQGKLLGSYSDLSDNETFKTMLQQHGIPEDIFEKKTKEEKQPQSQPQNNQQDNEIERLDNKTNEVAIFDKNTKQFLRWK